jgi:hypothetical protein
VDDEFSARELACLFLALEVMKRRYDERPKNLLPPVEIASAQQKVVAMLQEQGHKDEDAWAELLAEVVGDTEWLQ